MNSPNSVVIVQQKNPLDLKKCVICKNVRDSKGEKKLTSTEKGRKTLIECSNVLKDDLFKYLKLEELSDIKYHVNPWYAIPGMSSKKNGKKKQKMSKMIVNRRVKTFLILPWKIRYLSNELRDEKCIKVQTAKINVLSVIKEVIKGMKRNCALV